MVIEVLDACSIVAYLLKEPGGDIVKSLVDDPSTTCLIHSINLCEVYYQMIRASNESMADQTITDLLAAGIVERKDMDRDFWQGVGQIKARGRISLADCFCVTLAMKVGGRVVTADHGEFDPLVPLGFCPILFIR